MNITPRAGEVAAVAALLESGEHEDAKALAKAVIKLFWTLFEERDQYAALYRFGTGDTTIAFGPFSGEGEAGRFLKTIPLPKPARMLELPLNSVAQALRKDAEVLAEAAPAMCQCGHPAGPHQNAGLGGKCAQRGCSCKKLRPVEMAAA